MKIALRKIFAGKNVILIGGKPPTKNWSNVISRYDVVVRVNYPRYLEKQIGYAGRTDVLFMGNEFTQDFSNWLSDKLKSYQIITWTKNILKHKVPKRKKMVIYPTILPELITRKVSSKYLNINLDKPFRSGLIAFYIIKEYGACKKLDLLGFSRNTEDFLTTQYYDKTTFEYTEADKYHCNSYLEIKALSLLVNSNHRTDFLE